MGWLQLICTLGRKSRLQQTFAIDDISLTTDLRPAVEKRLDNKKHLLTERSSSYRTDRGRNAYLRSLSAFRKANTDSAVLSPPLERADNASTKTCKRLRLNASNYDSSRYDRKRDGTYYFSCGNGVSCLTC